MKSNKFSKNNSQTSKNNSPPQPSLPKGGGTLRGMGGAFELSSFSGAASYSLPVFASSGGGLSPELAVTYSSNQGNSPWGLGWNLFPSHITRKTTKGIPQYDGKDLFVFSGSTDLVPRNTPSRTVILEGEHYTVQQYYQRNEGDFSLIEYWYPQGFSEHQKSFWKVTSASHQISIFGKSQLAKISDPDNPDHVFTWLLEETYDTLGNHQLIVYKPEDTIGVKEEAIYERNHTITANRYIDRICYGHKNPIKESLLLSNHPALHDPNFWHFEVVFDYGEYNISSSNKNPYQPVNPWAVRPDPFSVYVSGFEVRTYRRCFHTLMFHRFKELGNDPVLIHASQYHYQTNGANISELVSTTDTGYQFDIVKKTYKTASLPSLDLNYTLFQPKNTYSWERLTTEQQEDLSGLNEAPEYNLTDLYGEGIPGILYKDGKTTYYREPLPHPSILNKNSKSENRLKPLSAAIYGNTALQENPYVRYSDWKEPKEFPVQRPNLDEDKAILADVDGNGQLDMAIVMSFLKGYWEVQPNHQWDDYQAFDDIPTDLKEPSQAWADLTGNSLADIVQFTSETIRIYPCLGKKGWGDPIVQLRPNDMPVSLDSTNRKLVQFVDLAGSGTPQLVCVRNGEVTYWPSLGYGRFGKVIKMENAPRFSEDFKVSRLFMADLDGSGTMDLIYFESTKALIYLNESGNRFSDAIEISLPIQFNDAIEVTFSDVKGRGNSCLILGDLFTTPQPTYWCYDFCHGLKPYLLHEINGNTGAITEITYGSSVDFYLNDKRDGLPWITSLPFPVHVVSSVTNYDEISQSRHVSHYAYHHGYYDGEEREFRGFGRVDSQDEEYFPTTDVNDNHYVAPTLNITWYHTGAYFQNQEVSRQYAKEYYQGDKEAFNFPDSVIDWEGKNPDPETYAQAFKALAGSVLRSEFYALDDKKESACPYTVSESNYRVCIKQPKGQNKYAVFLVHGQEGLSYNYERNPKDPQIGHEFTLEVDEFGETLKSCSVAYGRRPNPEALPEQLSIKVLGGTAKFAAAQTNPNHYTLSIPLESQSYHFPDIGLPQKRSFQFEEIKEKIDQALSTVTKSKPSSPQAVLLGWGKNYYADVVEDNQSVKTVILPFGEVPLAPKPLLPGKEEDLQFSHESVVKAFEGVLDSDALKAKLQKGYYYLDPENEYWWSISGHPEYAGAADYYAVLKTIDPSGQVSSYTYDPYFISLIKAVDPLGNTTEARNFDYQILQPTRLVDINGNISEVKVDPLGQVIYTSHYGHEGDIKKGFSPITEAPTKTPQNLQDIFDHPEEFLGKMGTYFYYDLFAWKDRKQPCFSLGLSAQNYPDEAPLPPQRTISYSDGFGRNLQSKVYVDPGESFLYDSKTGHVTKGQTDHRWLSSSRVIYDNKGQPIKQFEPYFINTYHYIVNDILNTFGFSGTVFYDPVGRVTHAITAKGFLAKQEWTPWEDISWDANDILPESPYYKDNISNPDKNSPYYDPTLSEAGKKNLEYIKTYFADTPSRVIHDNMGNTLVSETLSRSQDDPKGTLIKTYATYDIQGNTLTSADGRLHEKGLYNFKTVYGLNGAAFKTWSADGGTHWTLANIFGNPLFGRDSRDVTITTSYDELHRPIETHVLKIATPEDSLALNQVVERFTYGDTKGAVTNPEKNNLRGQVIQHYDQAGMQAVEGYSMGGQPLSGYQQFRVNYQDEACWGIENPDSLLGKKFSKSAQYDALGRVREDIDQDGNITKPEYSKISGLLQKIDVTTADDKKMTTYINGITYNAKGQRLSIMYGKGIITTYDYDPKTWAVTHIKSTNAANEVLQDLHYLYDPMENVIQKTDISIETVYHKNQAISPIATYTYDSLYQLIAATGREKIGSGLNKSDVLGSLKPHANDDQAITNYLEKYTYDIAGNLLKTEHSASSQPGWTRAMVISDTSNRGVSTTINGKNTTPPTPGQVDSYFDRLGNQIRMEHLNPMRWNYRNNIEKAVTVTHDDGTSDTEYYIYDSGGQRVRKVNETYGNGGTRLFLKETLYLGCIEIRKTFKGSASSNLELTQEYHSLRIADIATRHHWVTGNPPSGFLNPTIIYHLKDHLESGTVEVNEQGQMVSREEYSPYGNTTLFVGTGSAAELKHYRYSGKERDSVTGFYYYGMRYYAPWLGRWMNPDPAGTVDGLNLFAFVGGNPVTMEDIGGMCEKKGGKGGGGGKKRKAPEPKTTKQPKQKKQKKQKTQETGPKQTTLNFQTVAKQITPIQQSSSSSSGDDEVITNNFSGSGSNSSASSEEEAIILPTFQFLAQPTYPQIEIIHLNFDGGNNPWTQNIFQKFQGQCPFQLRVTIDGFSRNLAADYNAGSGFLIKKRGEYQNGMIKFGDNTQYGDTFSKLFPQNSTNVSLAKYLIKGKFGVHKTNQGITARINLGNENTANVALFSILQMTTERGRDRGIYAPLVACVTLGVMKKNPNATSDMFVAMMVQAESAENINTFSQMMTKLGKRLNNNKNTKAKEMMGSLYRNFKYFFLNAKEYLLNKQYQGTAISVFVQFYLAQNDIRYHDNTAYESVLGFYYYSGSFLAKHGSLGQ